MNVVFIFEAGRIIDKLHKTKYQKKKKKNLNTFYLINYHQMTLIK